MRKTICQYIIMYNISVNLNARGKPFVPRQTRPLNDSHRHSAEVLAVNSQRGSNVEGQTKASLPCIFCKGYHFNDV